MATVGRPCAALIKMSSAACVRNSIGQATSAYLSRISSRSSKKHSTPRDAGTEYSISLNRFSRTVGNTRQLSSTRSRSGLDSMDDVVGPCVSLGGKFVGLSVLVTATSPAEYQ